MPKVTGPCFSLDAQKSMRKTITYQRRPSGNVVFPWSRPGGREPFAYSSAQWAQRAKVKAYVAAWRALDVNYREQWDDLAKELGEIGTGYHLYIKNKGVYPGMVNVLWCDGVNDTVNCGKKSSLNFTTEFTIEGWNKQKDLLTADSFIGRHRWNGKMTGFFADVKVDQKLEFMLGDGVAHTLVQTEAGVISAGESFHFACTFVGGVGTIYKNGVLRKAQAGCVYAPNLPGNMYVSYADAGIFGGLIGEVRVWNKALDVKDIAIHAKKYRDISCANTTGCSEKSNLVAHYKMLEGTGTVLVDSSGYGNDGSFLGAGQPAWKQAALFKDIYGLT